MTHSPTTTPTTTADLPHHCLAPVGRGELAKLVTTRPSRRSGGPGRRYTSAPATRGGAQGHADRLIRARVVTLDPAGRVGGALAITDGRISAIGSAEELDGLRGPSTEVLDLGDQVVYPGFVEPHMHLWSTGLFHGWLDCSPLRLSSMDAVLDMLRSAAAKVPAGGWLLGQLWDPSLVAGEPDLTRDILDQVCPHRPALVMNASMHFAYVNSAALAAAGIGEDHPDPGGGGFFGRTDGRLNGIVAELPAISLVLAKVPPKSHEQFLDSLVEIMGEAVARGVTRVHEAGTGALFGNAELDMLHELADAGRLPVRVSTAQLDAAHAMWATSGIRPGDGDDMVRAVSWKIIGDGSNQGRTGYQKDPYLGRHDCGQPNLSPTEMTDAIRRGHEGGWQVMVHANGDAAIAEVIEAYRTVFPDGVPGDPRHRIEHCSVPHADDLHAMAELGLSPSFLMNHVYYWGAALRDNVFGPDKAARLDPVASARAQGLRASFHSDYNVSPIDPLRSVQTAVTRAVRDGGAVLNAAERDVVEAAMRAVTIDAAWQVHADDSTGSIEVGKYADLVMLAADPMQVASEEIAGIEVLGTLLAGESPPTP